MIKSRIWELMAKKRIKSFRELGRIANLSWKVVSNLEKDIDIDTIQLGNLLKVCLALDCTLDELLIINYKNIKEKGLRA